MSEVGYDGDAKQIRWLATDVNGSPIAPVAVEVSIRRPDNTWTTPAAMQFTGPNIYTYIYPLEPGSHSVRVHTTTPDVTRTSVILVIDTGYP